MRIQACEEGRHSVGKEPIELVLYEGQIPAQLSDVQAGGGSHMHVLEKPSETPGRAKKIGKF